jgi:acetyltransferase-like isoleucine patch superfamily enzyme
MFKCNGAPAPRSINQKKKKSLTLRLSFINISYAATHSTDVAERQKGLERAYPITVGDDVWIGGSTVLIGPCTIGNGC